MDSNISEEERQGPEAGGSVPEAQGGAGRAILGESSVQRLCVPSQSRISMAY